MRSFTRRHVADLDSRAGIFSCVASNSSRHFLLLLCIALLPSLLVYSVYQSVDHGGVPRRYCKCYLVGIAKGGCWEEEERMVSAVVLFSCSWIGTTVFVWYNSAESRWECRLQHCHHHPQFPHKIFLLILYRRLSK